MEGLMYDQTSGIYSLTHSISTPWSMLTPSRLILCTPGRYLEVIITSIQKALSSSKNNNSKPARKFID